jgi:hypothetical protein
MTTKRAFWMLLIAGLVALCVFWSFGVQHWIAWYTGSYNTSGVAHNYNFWSGFGSDLGEYVIATSIFGGAIAAWRVHTCHAVWWCWRRPLHQLGSSPYKVCHVHHPEDVASFQQVMADCKQYVEEMKADG